MTTAEYNQKILDRAKELADEWRSSWGTDLTENYNDLVSEPTYFEDIFKASGGAVDWSQVATDLADAIAARKKESDEIGAVIMGEFGFEYVGTGGGCDAYQKELGGPADDPPHFMVSDNDAAIPATWDTEVVFGWYPDYGSGVYELEHFDTVREFVDAMRKGTAHPRLKGVPQGGAPAQAPATVSADDLAVINQHRRGLGMAPLDPGAGWTTEELREMADSIRTTGRMHNPRTNRLKRSLLR